MYLADSIHADRTIDIKGAYEDLTEKLRSGEKVNGLTLRDLLDDDLSGERCQAAALEVISILMSEYPDTPLMQERYIGRVIGNYLDSHDDVVREHAENEARAQ